jgi:hypothetical protein
MKFLISCLTVFVTLTSAHAASERSDGFEQTKVITNMKVRNENYIVSWNVNMQSHPPDTEIFKNCHSEIQDTLRSTITSMTKNSRSKDRLLGSFKTTCSRHRIRFGAKSDFHRR